MRGAKQQRTVRERKAATRGSALLLAAALTLAALTFGVAAPARAAQWTTSVVINDGDAYADSVNVQLTLSATSSGGPVTDFAAADGPGTGWPSWTPFSGSPMAFPWVLEGTGDGEKRVYVKFRDAVEESSLPHAHDTIILDRAPPWTGAPKAAVCRKGRRMTLKYWTRDLMCRTASVWIVITRSTTTVATIKVGSKPADGTVCNVSKRCRLRPGKYRFTVWARDLAGNESTIRGSNRLTVRK